MDAVDFFDSLLEADRQNQNARAVREARQGLEAAKRPRCGSCYYWMMSHYCPAEKNVNGMSKGPSSDSKLAISCSKFQMSDRALKNIETSEQYLMDKIEIAQNAK